VVLNKGIKDTVEPIAKKTYWQENGKRKSKTLWLCPYYTRWTGMLERCYSEKHHKVYPSYIGCSVCEEWLLFSNFRAWCIDQEKITGFCIKEDKLQLDKDIKVEGNKIYSPTTCILLPNKVNSFIIKCNNTFTGTVVDSRTGNIITYCRNPFTNKVENLGVTGTKQEGHSLWVERKIEHTFRMESLGWINTEIRGYIVNFIRG
jgi:hypothetical protein